VTIYIYGSKSFKNNIHEVLEHANMKFRLSEDDSILELMSLDELKEAIEENPKDIFLIDDEKILKKNALNNKIKFLKPKDGIEEEFLKEHGIGDLSVDDIEDIATHVIRKLKKAQALKEAQKEEAKEEYVEKQNNDIASKNNEYEFVHGNQKTAKDSDEFQEEDLFESYSSDQKLEELEHHNEEENEDDNEFNIDDVINFEEEAENEEETFPKAMSNEDRLTEEPFIEEENKRIENLEDEDFGLTIEKIEQKGDSDMSDEFSELDSLSEDELLEALNGSSVNSESNKINQESVKKSSAEVELNSSSIHDISSLITQLLNNKTLEITIKIKE
jgi:hypothetical protein